MVLFAIGLLLQLMSLRSAVLFGFILLFVSFACTLLLPRWLRVVALRQQPFNNHPTKSDQNGT